MVLKRGNSTFFVNDKNATNFDENSSLVHPPQKKRSASALFLNTTPYNSSKSIVLFDSNTTKPKNSFSSFLSPKMADAYIVTNQDANVDDFKPIDKDGNEISLQTFINKIESDRIEKKTTKTPSINLSIQLESETLDVNLKTDRPNLSNLNLEKSKDLLTNKFIDDFESDNKADLLNTDDKKKDIKVIIPAKITSSDIVIANTFALLEISKSAERKLSSARKDEDDTFSMLPLLDNGDNEDIKTFSRIAFKTQQILRRSLTHSIRSSNASSLV